MPSYDWECEKCGYVWELSLPSTPEELGRKRRCPKCNCFGIRTFKSYKRAMFKERTLYDVGEVPVVVSSAKEADEAAKRNGVEIKALKEKRKRRWFILSGK